MPYILHPAPNAMVIRERQYAVGNPVRFSAFTSCLGLMAWATDENVIRAVHLSLLDENDHPFDDDAVGEVLTRLLDYRLVVVVGHVTAWTARLPNAYRRLIGQLRNPHIIDAADGIYGGQIAGGNFQLYQAGVYTGL